MRTLTPGRSTARLYTGWSRLARANAVLPDGVEPRAGHKDLEERMRRRLYWRLKEIAHRRGWIASPALAFRGVPFGPQKRDMAGEVMAVMASRHDAGNCSVCYPDAYRSDPAPEDSHRG